MRLIRSGNYSYPRIGDRRPVARGAQFLPFYVPDGEIVLRWEGKAPSWATPAERAMKRATLPAQILPAPPWPVTEDTQFGERGVGPSFEQQLPHTPVFSPAAGVRLVFESGNYINCKLPDEVAPEDIGDVNNVQGELVLTGVQSRPLLRVHAEDEVTATFTAALREEIDSGRWAGHRRLGLVKAAARARREDPVRAAADLDAIRTENAGALVTVADAAERTR